MDPQYLLHLTKRLSDAIATACEQAEIAGVPAVVIRAALTQALTLVADDEGDEKAK